MTTQQTRNGRGLDDPPPRASSQDENTSGTFVDLVFWAGAKSVAGTGTERWPADSVGAALQAAADRRQDARFDRLLAVCTVLVGGVVLHRERWSEPIRGAVRAEILPPFAGGAPNATVKSRCGKGEQAR